MEAFWWQRLLRSLGGLMACVVTGQRRWLLSAEKINIRTGCKRHNQKLEGTKPINFDPFPCRSHASLCQSLYGINICYSVRIAVLRKYERCQSQILIPLKSLKDLRAGETGYYRDHKIIIQMKRRNANPANFLW